MGVQSAEPQVPKVSMGLPVYNVERYLDESIESFLESNLSRLRIGHIR